MTLKFKYILLGLKKREYDFFWEKRLNFIITTKNEQNHLQYKNTVPFFTINRE